MVKTALLKNELAITIFKVFMAIVALAASAQIAIPLNPVPITLQTAVVMIIGLTYSPVSSFFATTIYIALGALGAPIFQGFAYGIDGGPSCGYLMGFVPSAVAISYMRTLFGDSVIKTFIYSVIGTAIIFLLGVSWLSNFIDFRTALYDGCIVFIPTGLLKILFVTATVTYLRKAS